MKKPALAIAAVAFLGLGGVMLVPVGGGAPAPAASAAPKATPMDLSSFSDQKPDKPLRLLFIHHSCGGQMFAPAGEEKEVARCIYVSHPNGGGARKLLEAQGYEVHEASYGSEIGEATDLFDWLPKFKNKGDKLLGVDQNDRFFTDGRVNQIVVFKSCYPNSDFVGEGVAPGNPAGPELTYWNARATLSALLPELQKHPEVLYVYMTAPPRAPKVDKERAYKAVLKAILGKPSAKDVHAEQAALARKFNTWVVAKDGWLKDYPLKNLVVFDHYDLLTDKGASNLSRYATEDGWDSHPSRDGNTKAAAEFVPFVNRAVRRAGLAQ